MTLPRYFATIGYMSEREEKRTSDIIDITVYPLNQGSSYQSIGNDNWRGKQIVTTERERRTNGLDNYRGRGLEAKTSIK